MLRDPAPPVAPRAAACARGERAPVVVPPPPPPDLVRLLSDAEARVRRRAALAIGRVGLRDGIDPLVSLLARPRSRGAVHGGVRAGSHRGQRRSGPAGRRRLVTTRPSCREAPPKRSVLSATRPPPMRSDVSRPRSCSRVRSPNCPARMRTPGRDLPASAFRLAIYALVRLKAYDQLAAAVLDASGQPKVRWWPVAYAFQRIDDKRALTALLTLAKESHPYTRAFAAKGLGGLKDASAVPDADRAARRAATVPS